MSKKAISLVLSLLMIFSVFAVPMAQAEGPDIGEDISLRVRYLFNGNFDDTQRDGLDGIPGNGSGVSFVEDDMFGTVLDLAGGGANAGNYVQIPGEAFGGTSPAESMTVTGWIYIRDDVYYSRFFDFGVNSTKNFFFMPMESRAAITVNGSGAEYQARGKAISLNEWHHVAVVLDAQNKTLTSYLDGVRLAQKTNVTPSFADIRSENASQNKFYIGKSQYSDGLFNGKMFDFRLYDVAKDAAGVTEIMDEALTDDANVNSAMSAVNLGDLENRTTDLTFRSRTFLAQLFLGHLLIMMLSMLRQVY